MSCIFCNSFYHLSQNCNVYESDEIREEIIQRKTCCKYCSLFLENDKEDEHSCQFYSKCFLCFKKYHPTFLCPDRFTGLNFFIPNIDKICFDRFFQMLDPLEQYSIAFSSSIAFNLLTLKPIKVINYVDKGFYGFPNSGIFVISNMNLHFRSSDFSEYNWGPLLSEALIIRAKNVNLSNIQISAADFLKLISIYTRILRCSYLKFTTKIKFSEILQMAPFIDEIDLYETNVEIEDTWIDHLMRCYKKFRSISITINLLNFEQLVNFIKTKCCNNVVITLHITVTSQNVHEKLQKKLLQHFLPSTISNQMPLLTLYSRNFLHEITRIGSFILKNDDL